MHTDGNHNLHKPILGYIMDGYVQDANLIHLHNHTQLLLYRNILTHLYFDDIYYIYVYTIIIFTITTATTNIINMTEKKIK